MPNFSGMAKGGCFMTTQEICTVRFLRLKGESYASIARTLSVDPSAIRMFCNRNKMTDADLEGGSVCVCCGKSIEQPRKGGRKLFCSERCRSSWRRLTNRLHEKVYDHVCAGCGVEFTTCGNKGQRYCSWKCYNNHRGGSAA